MKNTSSAESWNTTGPKTCDPQVPFKLSQTIHLKRQSHCLDALQYDTEVFVIETCSLSRLKIKLSCVQFVCLTSWCSQRGVGRERPGPGGWSASSRPATERERPSVSSNRPILATAQKQKQQPETIKWYGSMWASALCDSHLACVFNVDVVDEFTQQPEIFLTARP